MTEHFRTIVTQVSPEALELVEGGILILFADGAPAELAEVSVLHRVQTRPTAEAPAVGAQLRVGDLSTNVTAVGEFAWQKIDDMGHVVINFDGSAVAPRPGEISVAPVDLGALAAQLRPGAEISLHS
jgi:PTS system glucitol/sorbitol-specific IIA component